MIESRRNSFDVLRLLAALSVLLSHQMAFAGMEEPALGPLGISLASTGLYVFFALSGFLVFQSLQRNATLAHYFRARILRIYPGSAANLIFCIGLGWLVTDVASAAFWSSSQTLSYFFHNLSIFVPPTQFYLPGVLNDATWPVVNGSIWTIKYELFCYVFLFILYRTALALRASIFLVLSATLILLVAIYVYEISRHSLPSGITFFADYNAFNVKRFLMTFTAGAWLAASEPRRAGGRLLAWSVPSILILFSPTPEIARAGVILLLALFVIEVGQTPLLFSAAYRRVGDLSYGTFLYAYPIQNLIVTKYAHSAGFLVLTVTSLIATLICAFLSWQLVERPFLRMKQRGPRNRVERQFGKADAVTTTP